MNSMGPICLLKKTLRFKLLDKMPIRVEFLDILLWDLICKLLLHHWHRINHSGKNFYRKDTCFSFSSRRLRIPWVEPIIRYLKNFRTFNLMAANSNNKNSNNTHYEFSPRCWYFTWSSQQSYEIGNTLTILYMRKLKLGKVFCPRFLSL